MLSTRLTNLRRGDSDTKERLVWAYMRFLTFAQISLSVGSGYRLKADSTEGEVESI